MRLIDADVARKALVGYERYTGIDELPIEYAANEIDRIPAIDASPVRHATLQDRMPTAYHPDLFTGECSACEDIIFFSSNYLPNYCPACGAKFVYGRRNR